MNRASCHSLILDRSQPSRFPLGQIVITRHALDTLPPEAVRQALARHAQSDSGELDDEDRRANEWALQEGYRVESVYRAGDGTKFWIITEADRSVTTILLPADY